MNSPLPDVGASDQATDIGPGSLSEVVTIFFKLGLSSFGGPIAHLDYYHREFVRQRGWLDEGHYRQLLALCQFLPGPASTQMCYSIGALRAGTLGGLGAFLAFSVPSGLLLYLFALYSESLNSPWGLTVVHGLKLVTVVVVAQGVWSMARSLTPDMPRIAMAALATGLALRYNNSWMQLAIIGLGAMLGMVICRKIEAHKGEAFPLKYGRRTGAAVLAVFALLLVLALFWTPHLPLMGQVAGSFYRSGALVFGGGHVVLPLLRQTVVDPGWVNDNTFLAGYGAAQAVPGPLFAVAAFLGARVHQGQGGAWGAIIGFCAIFLPGILLISGTLPFWRTLGQRHSAARMLAGVNAVVVGILAAALYNPLWITAVHDVTDVATVIVGFGLLTFARLPSLMIVVWCVATAWVRAM
jgi:chromate transporter